MKKEKKIYFLYNRYFLRCRIDKEAQNLKTSKVFEELDSTTNLFR